LIPLRRPFASGKLAAHSLWHAALEGDMRSLKNYKSVLFVLNIMEVTDIDFDDVLESLHVDHICVLKV
jgi:hypothetical protein